MLTVGTSPHMWQTATIPSGVGAFALSQFPFSSAGKDVPSGRVSWSIERVGKCCGVILEKDTHWAGEIITMSPLMSEHHNCLVHCFVSRESNTNLLIWVQ